MNHCLRYFCSTFAPERQEQPFSSTCSSANTVWSTGSQLTSPWRAMENALQHVEIEHITHPHAMNSVHWQQTCASGRQPVLCARIFFPLIGKGIKWKGGENFTIYFIYTEFANINQSSNGQEATLIIAGLTIIKSAIRLIIVWPIAFTLALLFSCLFGDNNICCSNSSGDLEGL